MSYGNNNYGYGNSNPYAESYELDSYGKTDDSNDFVNFMNEINDINNNLDSYKEIIEIINKKQASLVVEINEEQEEVLSKQIDGLVSEANALQQTLKSKIKNAQSLALHDQAKAAQAETSRQRFLKYIEEYRLIEADHREQTRKQAERQFRIVRPDASDAEVREAVEDAGGQQIFSQALLQSNRRGEAKTALAEVQARHRELQKLEKTMAELTQLFHDMEELVAEQDVAVQQIDEQVETAQHDIEQGVGHTNKAVKSARAARKKKCWCFIIIIIIICIIVAAIVAPVVATRH